MCTKLIPDVRRPYNEGEPVLTLGPEVIEHESDEIDVSHIDADMPLEAMANSCEIEAATESTGHQNAPLDDGQNELLASLLVLPEEDEAAEDDTDDIPPLDEHPSAGFDYMSPSDTVTTASVSSIASPPATEDRSVRFDLPVVNSTALHAFHTEHTLSSIFLAGIEDDFALPMSSPSSTPTVKSRFLQNPSSPAFDNKAFAGFSSFASSYTGLDPPASFLHGSPSRDTAFDVDLMPEWTFDHYDRPLA